MSGPSDGKPKPASRHQVAAKRRHRKGERGAGSQSPSCRSRPALRTASHRAVEPPPAAGTAGSAAIAARAVAAVRPADRPAASPASGRPPVRPPRSAADPVIDCEPVRADVHTGPRIAPHRPGNLLDRVSAPGTLDVQYRHMEQRERTLLARGCGSLTGKCWQSGAAGAQAAISFRLQRSAWSPSTPTRIESRASPQTAAPTRPTSATPERWTSRQDLSTLSSIAWCCTTSSTKGR